MTPTLTLAFAAGIFSFLSPCVLPLVPSYLAYIGGSSATRQGALARRWITIRNSLLFILGFSLIFVGLGASASALGGLLAEHRSWLIVASGILVLLFGLMMLGVLRLPLFYRDSRLRYSGDSSTPVGALLLGMAFAAGWTPCIGPILGSILTLAGASGTLSHGVMLLGAYALGLALPFFAAAVALESFTRFTTGFKRLMPWAERAAGAILLVAGILMVTGLYTALNTYLIQLTPEWLWERL